MADALDPLVADSPRDFELIQVAGELIQAGRHDYSVIAIQTAVEVYVEQRLAVILNWRDLGPLGDVITEHFVRRRCNLNDDRSRALWKALTQDEIHSHDEWWGEYRQHLKRRNDVVHAGKHVTEEEALASLKAASALMNHVQHVLVTTGVRLGKLAEVGTPLRSDPDPY